ncbi:type II toxin-antitoxin system PemK/MazF family toxin [uncultured Thiodictyon sp.]|uniref:type II toxin-antitoxin system PemK/MazF family toxin n=1 Tax=uncultured Thiodictyon sp. TaxID=1846217 RepID=UPI0025F63EDC|nr:type II toxin-antitoxin system PemK/MazF family toxin [uncultured Thiodictyon sp.]
MPITSCGNFARSAGFAVSLVGAGTSTTGVIRCDQPRILDLSARNARRLEAVPASLMDEVLARLAPLFTPRGS